MSNIRINAFPSRQQFTYAGGTPVFVVNFPFFENTDLYVYLGNPANNFSQEDPQNLLIYGTQYTVTGAGLNTGGTITILPSVNITIGWTVTIVGRMPIDRYSIYENSSVISMAQLNEDFNRIVVMIQNINTIIEQTMPKYDRSEVINTIRSQPNTPFSYVNLPLLEQNEVWIGNATSTGITKGIIPLGGYVGVNIPSQRPSIALWTGVSNNVLTDSAINISGDRFIPVTTGQQIGFDDSTSAMHWPAHATTGRPASPVDGDTYYDTTTNQFFGYQAGVWVPFNSTAATPVIQTINQTAHGFTVGQIVRFDQGTLLYTLAQADDAEDAESIGFVIGVPDANTFTLQVIGWCTAFTGLTPGSIYFLSDSIPGLIQTTEPTANGTISKPVLNAITATTGWILHYRGVINNGNPENSGSTGLVVITVMQVAHGFTVGQAVYNNADGTYALAKADATLTARAVGIVVAVQNANSFSLQQSGYASTFTGLTPAAQYWLSDVTAGLIQTTAPTTPANWLKPMLQAVTATAGWVLPQLPTQIPSSGGGGAIIQVVSGLFREPIGPITIAPITFIALGVATVITPASTSNLVKVGINLKYASNNGWARSIRFFLYRNGVAIADAIGDNTGLTQGATTCDTNYTNSPNGGLIQGQLILDYVDNPSSSSAVTYEVYAQVSTGTLSSVMYLNRSVLDTAVYNTAISTVILEEIAV